MSDRVLIVAIGSRGDVTPYVGLGTRLRDAGYRVAVAAHEPFGATVADAGLEFRSVPGEVHALNSEVLVSPKLAEKGARLSMRARGELLTAYWREVAHGILAAAELGTDLLLLNFTGWLPGRQIAEAMGLPTLGLNVYPVHPTGEHPPVSLASARSYGRWGNRLAGRLTNWSVAQALLLREANRELRTTLGLPKASVTAVSRRIDADRWPILHGVSPTLLPRPRDWREGLEVVGFWWPHQAPDWQPPAELVDFLDAGPPPVFVGFGSTAHGDNAETADLVASALRESGSRGVIQTGWSGHQGDDVITIGETAYDWLFPRMAAVVHHAGVGTCAYGLRAAVPTVGIPLINDQHLWASRLGALGVGPAAIPFKELSSARLTAAIRAAATNEGYRDNARRIADRLSGEDGAGRVVEAVTRLLHDSPAGRVLSDSPGRRR
ncbi:glycosyltransferase [Actinokineospora xionganensis]|uniref:Glycosyltransferase family 1 protein n=1 Tax=Actinokineospora xionganensis TaxID=2684470 RepID=A0ABR7L9I5_9PSEU|nr:glycosyltransferase [Actinokineospora xionganensis]MBC6449044.1 glycosyltransferase family 1 protein [Actinokineospora xionganensis]